MAGRSQLPVQIMENQTRFDLNTAVENWRNELAAQPNLASDDRRELETQLRDAIAGFQQRGLNDEESFWLARRRVGQPPQLGEEFEKADPTKIWRERVFWMWLALFLSSTLGSLANSGAIAFMSVNENSHRTDQMVAAGIFFILAILVPIIIAVLLAKGKLVAIFTRLTLLVDNRLRLAIFAFMCVALSTSIRIVEFNYSHFSNPISNPLLTGLMSALYPIINALVLLWLMPPQNQKTPKLA
jgi:hypothetical protein